MDEKSITARVIRVHDGDTITVVNNEKMNIRLYGIDAPESNQLFGLESKQFLSDLILDKEVTININEQDFWGRSVGEVIINDINVNHELLKNGLAWWMNEYYPNDLELKDLEDSARDRKLGLWSQENPVSPWRWRKELKIQQMQA